MAKNKKQNIKGVISLYGNVTLQKEYCPNCKAYSFVIKGRLTCCDMSIENTADRIVREFEPPDVRKTPKKSEKEAILQEQDYCCFYCGVSFGSIQKRNGKPYVIKINWDHRNPYSFSQDNKLSNFVAACHVCNSIKSDKVFQTDDEIRVYLADKRKEKGWNF